jgi:hypothetical protein
MSGGELDMMKRKIYGALCWWLLIEQVHEASCTLLIPFSPQPLMRVPLPAGTSVLAERASYTWVHCGPLSQFSV